MAKTKKGYSAETFKVFMKAPCGRILVKAVLNDIGLKHKYKELLKFKESLLILIKKNFATVETNIYINESFL